MDELNALIGLDSVKEEIKDLANLAIVHLQRKKQGLKVGPISLHLVFTGNPGIGKTTVARIIAKIYKQLGLLSKDTVVEVGRNDLVAKYAGQTAIKTKNRIDSAMGGVLFIDEAYTLKRDDFGQEAIETLLKEMEEHRDNFAVIISGYTNEMERFIHSNSELQSRFSTCIKFPDYSIDDLERIFYLEWSKNDYTVIESAKPAIKLLIKELKASKIDNFAMQESQKSL